MPIIAVDIGNSFTKFGWAKETTSHLDNFLTIPNTIPIQQALVSRIRQSILSNRVASPPSERISWACSSVNPPRSTELQNCLMSDFPSDPLLVINQQQVPLKTEVEFPQRLGRDRLIAAWRATELSSHRPLVIIDAGTAVTLDFIDSRGIHVGGLILPGGQMMLAALGQQTNSLPDLSGRSEGESPDTDDDADQQVPRGGTTALATLPLYGINTLQAISLGVYRCQISVLHSCVRDAAEKWDQAPQVILTGGGIPPLRNHLPADWDFYPDLVLSGVYEIAKANQTP